MRDTGFQKIPAKLMQHKCHKQIEICNNNPAQLFTILSFFEFFWSKITSNKLSELHQALYNLQETNTSKPNEENNKNRAKIILMGYKSHQSKKLFLQFLKGTKQVLKKKSTIKPTMHKSRKLPHSKLEIPVKILLTINKQAISLTHQDNELRYDPTFQESRKRNNRK